MAGSDAGVPGTPDTYSTSYLAPHVCDICSRVKATRVLDLGCGNGSISRLLVRDGLQVVGCDPDPTCVEIAARRVPSARFQRLGVYDDPTELGESDFDLVVACEVIEHLFQPHKLPEFARVLLKPEGHLLVSTPYHGYLKNLAMAVANRWDTHHGVWDHGGHIKFFSRATLAQLLEECGFEVVSFRGAGRVPWLWKSMILVGRLSPDN